MSQISTEFIVFKVKHNVQPEDPGSELGVGLMRVFLAAKQQNGHQDSAWGRAVEDPNIVVWMIDWTDARCSINASLLQPFLAEDDERVMAIYATLSPSISSTDTLAKNPVTELCFLPFPSNMSATEARQLNIDLTNFQTALVVQLPQEQRPCSCAMGHVDRPSTVEHGQSPTGRALVRLLAVGWESVEAHGSAKKTKVFIDSIAPIREKLLAPPVPGLEMKHVSFRKI
ncbi:hypothetical protein F1880_003768 [Penicillium rolfsii]|nr:hypothetical protein F1880_003768 [Penicillium rolfsii]